MLDTRAEIQRLLGKLEFSSQRSLRKLVACVSAATAIAFLPEHAGLAEAGRWALFITLLAAFLWATEAIPAFAVALLIMALEIAILGRPGGPFASDNDVWMIFVQPWSSPLIWLFLGGFVLANAAAKTGIDRWFSGHVLVRFGNRPAAVLMGTMAITFTFSMFMSNTATTAMMMAVITPVVVSLPSGDAFGKALLLGIPFSANLGGMGTLIGTPPNAIAAGALATVEPIDFIEWMLTGLPPALILLLVIWIFLINRYPSQASQIDLSALRRDIVEKDHLPLWRRILVMAVFFLTVLLWMTEPIHGIPTPVVSFIPISLLAISGVVGVEEIRDLHWDVLLLIAGGLSLGVAVTETGLATWMVQSLPVGNWAGPLLAALLAYLAAGLSNLMSNTAASNILVPIGLAMGTGQEPLIVLPIALGASAAMCLPVSTPPNAVAYTTGRLEARDFLGGGLIVGLLAPPITVVWCAFLFGQQ